MRHLDHRGSGFSLVELVIVLVILVVTFPILTVISRNILGKMDEAMRLTIATDLARSLMEEIRSKRFDEKTDGTFTNQSALGIDTGETATNKNTFDDVDDFRNWSESPVKAVSNPSGNPIGDFSNFSSAINVYYVTSSNLTTQAYTPPGTDGNTAYKRVEVEVNVPGSSARVVLVEIRTPY